ncbi:peptidase domain-containing ABC transporter [Cytophagaceae bacterium YF14B1]|uniref:Peptidase domain-containing ABC transporter n=1 Tax=Xanthocytophaga flava TaxID=3048013 RepID=A0AAE3U5W6_9BACT|nr:peptidase domain-containing ABC transporter [Xanthocytophaga flavus]MDJ1480706.1 peptidase domain-containing ABC transporter [Xanthocytophaga flavus]
MVSFKHYHQQDAMDCGPTCLRMVAKYYGRTYSLASLRGKAFLSKEGVSLAGLAEAAENIGFKTLGVKTTLEKLSQEAPLPCIIHWNQNHFIVIYRISKDKVYTADPAKGLIVYTKEEFRQHWLSTYQSGNDVGVALLLEPTPAFYTEEEDIVRRLGINKLLTYLFTYKKLLIQLGLALLTSNLFQLLFPFLTQSIVDIGINGQNLNFIYLVLIAQTMLFIGKMAIDFLRSWILLHISTRINISILSDFFIKLMKLPLSFFDVKMYGDIMQRISDHQRIETFLTSQSLNILFSTFNLLIFSIILAYYNTLIFFAFAVFSTFYVIWVILFLKKRRELNFKQFEVSAKNQSSIIQLIQGMQEIKLANAERQKRWEWEHIQARLFRFNIKSLSLNQYQQAGAFFFNEGKNIFITFLAAKSVIEGEITLGTMLSVQYIIGQLNSPIEQLIGFVQSLQDAQISMERLNDIHDLEDEEPFKRLNLPPIHSNKSLIVKDLSFTYPGMNDYVLKDLNFYIPAGETTAIVGMSGSGKTTLLKLLLKFYTPSDGELKIGETNLKNISHQLWRSQCGVVMQEGYIFSDTIVNNIAVGDEKVDIYKLQQAAQIANIHEFIESLPLGYNTKIGAEGNGLSQGQKQRLLIARAVYKDPKFIFFDEATNALDTNNERTIMENLDSFFQGRTVIIVAHRLSTVRNADQIIVLHKGEIVEIGSHTDLILTQGHYYTLVKNQLELGE